MFGFWKEDFKQTGFEHYFLVVLLFIAVFIIFAGSYSGIVNSDDEALYVGIAREMFQRHEWIVPTLFDKPAFYKPPLVYWLMIISFYFFGPSLFAARLPVILISICTVFLIYIIGRELFGKRYGLLAAAMFATSFGLLSYGGCGLMDMPLTFTFALTVFCFIKAFRSNGKNFWGFLFFLFVGISTLIKGPVSAIILAVFALAACLIYKRFKIFYNMYALLGIVAGLFFIFLWPYFIFLKGYFSEWFVFFVLRENFGKFSDAFHYGSLKFLYYILQHAIPWSIFIFSAVIIFFQKKLYKKEEYVMLVLWAASIILVFLFPETKLKHFLFPVMPAAVLMVAAVVENYTGNLWVKAGYFFTSGILLFLFILNAVLFKIIPPGVISYNIFALVSLGMSIYCLFSRKIFSSILAYGIYVCFLLLVFSAFNFEIIPDEAGLFLPGNKVYAVKMQVYNFEYKLRKETIQIQEPESFIKIFNNYNCIVVFESDIEEYCRVLNIKPDQYSIEYYWKCWKKNIPFRAVIASFKQGNISPVSERVLVIRKI